MDRRFEISPWPQGRTHILGDTLRDLLLRSAKNHSRNVFEKFLSDSTMDELSAAISCGCAVELLAKAYLMSVAPSLLAARGDVDTVLHLSGNGHRAKSSATEIKTIGAGDALQLVKRLLPTFSYHQRDDVVLGVRNAAAHMALVDHKDLRRAVVAMVRIVEDLLKAMEVDRQEFWGSSVLPAVDQAVDAATSEANRIIAAKLAAARLRIDSLTSALDDVGKSAVLAALSGRSVWSGDYEEPQECPVCQQQAILICNVERGELEFEDEESGQGPYVELTAYPFEFICATCGLELDGLELSSFDFPDEIQLSRDDEPWEVDMPDEDLYRER